MNNTPETNSRAWSDHSEGILHEVVEANFARKLERERDEARDQSQRLRVQLNHYTQANEMAEQAFRERDESHKIAERAIAIQEERVNEAQKELSSIHRWIDKNHADGFIDSLTYLQNLERVVDNWYDRIDAIEADARRFVRERDEIQNKYDTLAVENMLEVNKLCKERDEALKESEYYRERYEELKDETK
jgi:hypothetical protein